MLGDRYMWTMFSEDNSCSSRSMVPCNPCFSLTQLLLGAEGVEARLRDDLTEELQKHILRGALHVCLVVYLDATVIVNFIPLLINEPSS